MAVSRAMRQIILMGIICFGTIGMFNAMSSIGNAGKHSPTAQNLAITSSSIAYIVGFLLAGGTHNMIGPRLCVVFGGLSFVLYAGSMLLAKDDDRSIYPPLAGILLGLGAGLIWVTHGAMMMSYPTEDNKGKYIAVFWAIFNLGAVIGSILPLVMNSAPGMDPDDVSPTTYIVYMVVMGLATLLAFFLARPSTIVRDNGEAVSVAKFSGLRAECVAILAVFCDWRMLLLIPAFFFSNFSYTYQFNDFNGFNFNIRTRSLNSMLFWIAQIIGAVVLGYLLDRIPVKRSRRAVLGLILVGVLFMATWVAALMVQLRHNWERKQLQSNDLIDYEHGSTYTGLLAIYAMFGFCDAAFAVYCYWLMGALSNKHDELSRYAGFFKSIQSLGGAVAAPLDLAQTPLKEYLITNWILCALSIAAMFLVCRTVTDTTIDDYDEQGDQSCVCTNAYDFRRLYAPNASLFSISSYAAARRVSNACGIK
ncbi:UNC93-like protein [Lobosporangium transversale]|uniref:UNC93-like protein n=1 Tax=Lobosporangium transversale TaxID=64571 RepID=A0A1Y2G6G3_9FUNG|nr:UNC93-like protein [Lobosporangium transversale]ORY98281.1 UNC93-like protein [Lobosporangium transversale]|eukprot:XP_021875710.1 UNC93-like protein [Lobosporangium transversale]